MASRKQPPRWDEREDDVPRGAKMRRHRRQISTRENFIVPRDDWELGTHAFAARVVEVHKRYAFVCAATRDGNDIRSGDIWLAHTARRHLENLRRERNFVTVGDWVLCRFGDETGVASVSGELPSCLIDLRAPRQNVLERIDPLRPSRTHILASGVDQVIVVASAADPDVRWRFIDRALIMAERSDVPVQIVITKSDRLPVSGSSRDEVMAMLRLYQQIGYRVDQIRADCPQSAEITRMHQLFGGKTSVVIGQSGVGKSSLVNLLKPEIRQLVEDDVISRKGRHTTSYASMIRLGIGGFLIDTPGIRALTFPQWSPAELAGCFPEIRNALGRCHYRECRHVSEPSCHLRELAQMGDWHPSRYQTYLALLSGESGRQGRAGTLSEAAGRQGDQSEVILSWPPLG